MGNRQFCGRPTTVRPGSWAECRRVRSRLSGLSTIRHRSGLPIVHSHANCHPRVDASSRELEPWNTATTGYCASLLAVGRVNCLKITPSTPGRTCSISFIRSRLRSRPTRRARRPSSSARSTSSKPPRSASKCSRRLRSARYRAPTRPRNGSCVCTTRFRKKSPTVASTTADPRLRRRWRHHADAHSFAARKRQTPVLAPGFVVLSDASGRGASYRRYRI